MVKINDVIYIKSRDPEDPMFDGCIAIVEEVKSWGVMAFVPVPAQRGPDRAYIRLRNEDIAVIGHLPGAVT